jgi:multidrug efflux pump subunit AcrA (membrane-fusion protein)
VVEDGQAKRTPITLGIQAGNDVEVVSGLKGGELIVQSPTAGLQDGQLVETSHAKAHP